MGVYKSGIGSTLYKTSKSEPNKLPGFTNMSGFGKARATVSGPSLEDGDTQYAPGIKSYKTGNITMKAHEATSQEFFEDALDDSTEITLVVERTTDAKTVTIKGYVIDISEVTVDGTNDPVYNVTIQPTSITKTAIVG